MKIALTGFMGAGKSSVATELARLCDLPSLELDDRIVETEGRAISAIFESDGEDRFRVIETESLKQVIQEEAPIISCGGGVVTLERNVELLREAGYTVVLLDAPFEEISKRVPLDGTRPLFQCQKKAESLYNKRLSAYRRSADVIVPTIGVSPLTIARAIAQLFSVPQGMKLFAVVGDPVGHSRSPLVHGAVIREVAGIDSEENLYLALRFNESEVDRVKALLAEERLHGLSITMPLKQSFFGDLDSISEAAEQIGAVNTVILKDGRLQGENTDWIGIVRTLEQVSDLKGKRAAVLGAGGTARAAVYGLLQAGASVTIFNRTLSKAEEIAEQFGCLARSLEQSNEIRECDIVVQTTSVGMGEMSHESPVPKDAFREGQVVLDVIYYPKRTQCLCFAEEAGALVLYGGSVFLEQALEQSAIFFGSQPERSIMERALGRPE